MSIQLDILQTLAIAVIVLYVGETLRHHIRILERLCIPSPVVGGLLFSVLTLLGHNSGLLSLELDTTLQSVFMTVFFTAMGFTCDVKVLLKYGKRAIQFTILLTLLVIAQNCIGVGLANVFGIHPLLGLCTGSASMTGGHGTAGSFAPLFEELYGCEGAVVVGLAAATFGLVSGGLVGGPVGNFLVRKHNLAEIAASRRSATGQDGDDTGTEISLSGKKMMLAANQIILCVVRQINRCPSLQIKTDFLKPDIA